MRRRLFLLVCVLVVTACNFGAMTSSPSPARTPDIKRSKLDIAYSFLVDADVHNVSSKKVLQGAVEALKAEARKTGGPDDFPSLELEDISEPVLADFRKFADAAAAFAARNTQLSADRFADTAIGGMIGASPDCHTYYVNKDGAGFLSRSERVTGSGPRVPAGGTPLASPDESGLQASLLPGGIAYITFARFLTTGTYKTHDEVRKVLDKALAAGARAWLFDLRGNVGGRETSVDILISFFLNGEPTLRTVFRNGPGGTMSALADLRLPAEYQLPIAIVLNDRGGSGPEVFAAALRENKRATLVGQKTVGCVGSANTTRMPDGSQITVVVAELSGAVTGTAYNNIGVPPDVQADDASAIDKAIEILKQKIAGVASPTT
ncbi:MAG TPA: S41 family peptidase [Candidatus Limnocylindria bacterium]|jgi:C-terminal processing protease CtpA/Prc|nr:S41 family peptidase [Candidatus Limnocylindria bacterium]